VFFRVHPRPKTVFAQDEKATAFARNMVDPRPMLQEKGLL
jgi:hypothetical protein